MTIEKWRTGESVHIGELTIEAGKAREKLRDYRLSDPHRWLLEIVAAANLGVASSMSVQVDSDEVLIVLHGIELTAEDLQTLWQAPFQKLSNPVTKRIALGLISAESLDPTRILLRSGTLEANLGPGHNRSLLERITTQLYPKNSAESQIQIYVRIPLKLARLVSGASTLPEFVYLQDLARHSKVPITLSSANASLPPLHVSTGDMGGSGHQRAEFDTHGLEGALNLTILSLRVTFVRDGVVTETVEQEALIPADIVVRTDRVNYDLSGTQLIRDDAYTQVMLDLAQIVSEAFEAQIADLSSVFDPIKSRLFLKLLNDFSTKRSASENVAETDLRLAKRLRAHRMWVCAASAPDDAPTIAGKTLISLDDAMPSGNQLHRSPMVLGGRVHVPQTELRAVLLTEKDADYLTLDASVPRSLVEGYLDAVSLDISGFAPLPRSADSRQNAPILSPTLSRVKINSYISSGDKTIQIGRSEDQFGELTFGHQGRCLLQTPGIPGVRVRVNDANPSPFSDGIADDEQAEKLAKEFAAVFVRFIGNLADSEPSSAIYTTERYLEPHWLALIYAKSGFEPVLIHFGKKAAISAKTSPSDLLDSPIFSTLPREADVRFEAKKILNRLSGNPSLEKASPLLSLRQMQATGKHLALCQTHEIERLIAAKYWEVDPKTVVVVGDENTEELLRLITGTQPLNAATNFRIMAAKIAFEKRGRVPFLLPSPREMAITTEVETPSGRYQVGLAHGRNHQIWIRFFYDGRVVEEAQLNSRGGAFVIACNDDRLTISDDFQSFLKDAGRADVEAEIEEICADLAIKYIQDNSTPAFNHLAMSLYAQMVQDEAALQELPCLKDLSGARYSLKDLLKWPQVQFIRSGKKVEPTLADQEEPILVMPDFFPEGLLGDSKDVSEIPTLRQQRNTALARFLAADVVPIQINREIDKRAKPGGLFSLVGGNFANKTTSGVVNLIGLDTHLVRVTVLHQRRLVSTHTLSVPFGEFEAVVDLSNIEFDDLYKEVKHGDRLADELIQEECGKCLLIWLRTRGLHDDAIAALRTGRTRLESWSASHASAAENLLGPKTHQEDVLPPPPKHDGATHECFRLFQEICGESQVLADITVRGFKPKLLGTGLPSQADGNVVHINPTHPTNKLALETDDPVWRAMLVSSAFTSLSLHWLPITNEHEEEFQIRLLDHMVKALRPIA